MKKLILITLVALLPMFTAMAKYTIHSSKGDVRIERGGQLLPVQKGMEVNATDNIHIPQGAKVEILNSVNSKIFTSTRAGEFNVTRIMIDAQIKANDHAANVGGNLQMTRLGKSKNSSPMWVQKGKVTRTMEQYDPTAEKMEADPTHLGNWIAATVNTEANKPLPVKVTHNTIDHSGLSFRLENTLDFPVYFNVIKIQGDSVATADISELGQPMGSYVVLPRQAISREQFTGLQPGNRHILIMTPYYFDIDQLIPKVRQAASEATTVTDDDTPAYILTL